VVGGTHARTVPLDADPRSPLGSDRPLTALVASGRRERLAWALASQSVLEVVGVREGRTCRGAAVTGLTGGRAALAPKDVTLMGRGGLLGSVHARPAQNSFRGQTGGMASLSQAARRDGGALARARTHPNARAALSRMRLGRRDR
jgi:hypothetical protein